jgi:enediyne biosynthesis protein E7
MRRDKLAFVRDVVFDYGDMVRFPLGRRLAYLISDPDDVRHVLSKKAGNYRKGIGIDESAPLFGNGLLSSEGAEWREQRALLQPTFQPANLERFAGLVTSSVDAMITRWRLRSADGAPVDIAAEMNGLALCIICKMLFGIDLQARASRIVADLELVGDWAMRRTGAPLALPLRLSMAVHPSVRVALKRINRLAAEIAAQIDRTSPEQDFAKMLCSMRRNGRSPAEAERRIRDEIVTFLVAGHETTAATVSWAWYLLCTHPEAMAKLRAELHAELKGQSPTYQQLARLRYTRMVVDETLRLYPSVWMITRRAVSDDVVGGYRIDAGSDVLVNIYSLHRHPRFWPDHDAFKPERFDSDLKQGASVAYWPFGAGPRACVAGRLGMAEAMLIIASIALRARFLLVAREIEAEPGLVLRPRGGIMAHIEIVEAGE